MSSTSATHRTTGTMKLATGTADPKWKADTVVERLWLWPSFRATVVPLQERVTSLQNTVESHDLSKKIYHGGVDFLVSRTAPIEKRFHRQIDQLSAAGNALGLAALNRLLPEPDIKDKAVTGIFIEKTFSDGLCRLFLLLKFNLTDLVEVGEGYMKDDSAAHEIILRAAERDAEESYYESSLRCVIESIVHEMRGFLMEWDKYPEARHVLEPVAASIRDSADKVEEELKRTDVPLLVQARNALTYLQQGAVPALVEATAPMTWKEEEPLSAEAFEKALKAGKDGSAPLVCGE